MYDILTAIFSGYSLGLFVATPLLWIFIALVSTFSNDPEDKYLHATILWIFVCMFWVLIGLLLILAMPDYSLKRILNFLIIWIMLLGIPTVFWRDKFRAKAPPASTLKGDD